MADDEEPELEIIPKEIKERWKKRFLFIWDFFMAFWDGIARNPLLVLLMGLCPVIAVSISLENAVGWSVASGAVLIASAVMVSSLKGKFPNHRYAHLMLFGMMTTVVALIYRHSFPSLYESLGIYLLLIPVNCMLLAQSMIAYQKKSTLRSFLHALGISTGAALVIVAISGIRELFSTGGLFFQKSLISLPFQPQPFFALAPGGFLVMGLLLAGKNSVGYQWHHFLGYIKKRKEEKKRKKKEKKEEQK